MSWAEATMWMTVVIMTGLGYCVFRLTGGGEGNTVGRRRGR